jgi:RimJ/RimL family protein N-acetyltransferase
MKMPALETERLLIRPFALDDLDAIHQILDLDAHMETQVRAERAKWLRWSVVNYEELAKLYQPPYGDRAVVLKQTNDVIGAIGFVPLLMPFGLLPYYQILSDGSPDDRSFPEVGLFWATATPHRRQGYAAEAGQALVDYAFANLNLRRIVATTEFDNEGSIGVMRRLGMTIERNPDPGHPPYLQVVGILENSRSG